MAIRNGCCSVAMTVPQAFAALRVIAINCGRPGNTRTTKREELLARISRDKRSGPSGVAPRSASDLFASLRGPSRFSLAPFASLRGHSRFSFAPSRPFAAIRGFHSPLRAPSRPFAVFTRPFTLICVFCGSFELPRTMKGQPRANRDRRLVMKSLPRSVSQGTRQW